MLLIDIWNFLADGSWQELSAGALDVLNPTCRESVPGKGTGDFTFMSKLILFNLPIQTGSFKRFSQLLLNIILSMYYVLQRCRKTRQTDVLFF